MLPEWPISEVDLAYIRRMQSPRRGFNVPNNVYPPNLIWFRKPINLEPTPGSHIRRVANNDTILQREIRVIWHVKYFFEKSLQERRCLHANVPVTFPFELGIATWFQMSPQLHELMETAGVKDMNIVISVPMLLQNRNTGAIFEKDLVPERAQRVLNATCHAWISFVPELVWNIS